MLQSIPKVELTKIIETIKEQKTVNVEIVSSGEWGLKENLRPEKCATGQSKKKVLAISPSRIERATAGLKNTSCVQVVKIR